VVTAWLSNGNHMAAMQNLKVTLSRGKHMVITLKPRGYHMVTTRNKPHCYHGLTRWILHAILGCHHHVVTTWIPHGNHVVVRQHNQVVTT
jgi:hypothetical protein